MIGMPFRNTRLIPRGLADWFAPTVAGSFTALIDIRHPDQVTGKDPLSGRNLFTEQAPHYVGGARVQGNPPAMPAEQPSGQTKAPAAYLVAVPHDVIARIGDVVRVRSDAEDPALAGLVLTVTGFANATVTLQRNLRCDLAEKAQKVS